MIKLRDYLASVEAEIEAGGNPPHNIFLTLTQYAKDKQRAEHGASEISKPYFPRHEISVIKDTITTALSKLMEDKSAPAIAVRIKLHEAITHCDELLRR